MCVSTEDKAVCHVPYVYTLAFFVLCVEALSYSMLIVDTDRKCYLPGQTAGYCRLTQMTDISEITKTGLRRRGDE